MKFGAVRPNRSVYRIGNQLRWPPAADLRRIPTTSKILSYSLTLYAFEDATDQERRDAEKRFRKALTANEPVKEAK